MCVQYGACGEVPCLGRSCGPFARCGTSMVWCVVGVLVPVLFSTNSGNLPGLGAADACRAVLMLRLKFQWQACPSAQSSIDKHASLECLSCYSSAVPLFQEHDNPGHRHARSARLAAQLQR